MIYFIFYVSSDAKSSQRKKNDTKSLIDDFSRIVFVQKKIAD